MASHEGAQSQFVWTADGNAFTVVVPIEIKSSPGVERLARPVVKPKITRKFGSSK